MLEWLSCGECYDVQLLCGGRVFNAHRAVLASVSNFLRCLLLSCPVEDKPTYIVLPEFEQDAMVSVLYYIYNGEVKIPTSKLKMFLDIAKALKIFIDLQYLPVNTGIIKESCNTNGKWPRNELFNNVHLKSTYFKCVPQLRTQKALKSLNVQTVMQKKSNNSSLENKQDENYTNTDVSERSNCVSSLSEYKKDITKKIHKQCKDMKAKPLKNIEHNIEKLDNSNDMNERSNNDTSRLTIHNKVLQSPWRPQLPKSYRPFCKQKFARRKQSESEDTTLSINNDNNNNTDEAGENKIDTERSQLPQESTEEDLKCPLCCQIFNNVKAYNIHMQHSCMTRYTCSYCNKTFSQLRNFKYHISRHRGTKEFATTCPVCGKYFNDRGYLSNHMKIHRNRKEYKCSLCPKSFNQRVAYNMHLRIHTGVKPHVCDECGKAFSRKMLLKQHIRTHSGERPYACPHCDKKFADRSNMTLHLRLHTGFKPFGCSECGKSFSKKHHLQSHMNFHTGVKPYSCPKCKLAFSQSSNMRTHFKKCFAGECSVTGS